MNVLAIIPARAGSKRVPRKNVREVGGRPLIAWTIEQARASKRITRLVVSTDDPEVMAIARGLDVEVLERPANLCDDKASSSTAVHHALHGIEADLVVLLQPTSPLRSTSDIDNCIYLAAKEGAPVVTVCLAEAKPETMFSICDGGKLRGLEHRDPLYKLNGAVYAAPVRDFLEGGFVQKKTIAHAMPADRSLDIDTETDMAKAHQALFQKLYEMVT